jgi:hypothetical protein
MNLVHSNGKPGTSASAVNIRVRFVPPVIVEFKIKESHETISSKPAVPINVIANRGASGKADRFSWLGPQCDAICRAVVVSEKIGSAVVKVT